MKTHTLQVVTRYYGGGAQERRLICSCGLDEPVENKEIQILSHKVSVLLTTSYPKIHFRMKK